MKLSAPWLDRPEIRAFCTVLETNGQAALFVGGAVRNTLMGREVTDLDLATDASPTRVITLAEGAGYRCIPTGIDHGTVTVMLGDTPLEVTTFRTDVTTDGRHATVAFGTSMENDAARRDFTMNALYADIRGQIFDPMDGLSDLHAGRVRFVGDPMQRVREDYLRILRFFRFSAWYGAPDNGLEPEGLAACAEGAEGLAQISAERIGAELKKLLTAPDPWPALAAMEQAGVLMRILPGATGRVAQVADHWLDRPDAIARLAWMGGDTPKERLRLSRSEAKRIAALNQAISGTDTPAALGYRLGAQDGWIAHIGRQAALGSAPEAGDRTKVQQGAEAQFPVTATDLAPLTGAELGARLKSLEAHWIDQNFAPTKSQLLAHPPK